MKHFVLFPINLYKDVSYLKDTKNTKVYLVEEEKFFDRNSKKYGSMKLNILKPIYHRASCQYYEDYLKNKNIKCSYIELKDDWTKKIKLKEDDEIYFFDPVDKDIEKKINSNYKNYTYINSPSFLLSYEEMKEYNMALRQTSFYGWIRKKLDILMERKKDKLKPIGGKLTYDSENRKSPYKGMDKDLPKIKNYKDKYIKESINYCKKNLKEKNYYLPNNIPLKKLSEKDIEMIFPINHKDSEKRLENFIDKSFDKFGDYQDAFLKDSEHSLLFHSGISVMMNVGLLTPDDVVERILNSYNNYKSTKQKNMLNNVEGFIRQIIGWREFSQYLYQFHLNKFYEKNFFNSKKKLSKAWYDGTTQCVPVDKCIKMGFKYGYLHHIERLMVMANYMTICQIHPNDMFKWFTEFALDSYDWVMAYNIYSMASYADGGNFTTKPYISSSNYIFKMSDYKDNQDNKEWSEEWNKRFWIFMDKHKSKIKKINRLGMILKHTNNNLKKLKSVKLFNH